ncbi:DNA-directed RNA polymerase subunit D [Halospeciosus flavus]|uniref:DNA-directed RNA polymerase subunit Rpo3 n=1 Tax=Halospeciosus flavus TaxID=3032283 RepID=A0ABD5Z278_9EURY|nr:DNA-directed RNA polymerase subunit D [Halospeciosus flavus]
MASDFDVEFIDHGDRESKFLLRGATPAFANGIRRAILADVPTLSIDTVRFVENSSVMFDENLALRLGLVPLTTPDDLEPGDEITLALDVEGPGTAYSGDLVSTDSQVEPADTNVPLIELKEDQRLELEADAVLGHGRDHAKHQGGVAVGYRHLQRVEVVGDAAEYADEETKIARGVIEDDGELVDTDEFDNDLTERYPGKEVELTDVENAFVFHVESDGSMPVDELVLRAVDTLYDRADELESAVQL